MKKKYFVLTIVCIALVLASFIYYLTNSSNNFIKEKYIAITSNSIIVAAKQKISILEYTIKYGTDINTLYTIGKHINQIKYTSSYINDIYIFDAEMNIILENVLNMSIDKQKRNHYAEIFFDGKETHYSQDEFALRIPVQEKDDKVAAYIVIELDKNAIEKNLEKLTEFERNIAIVVVLLLLGISIIVLQRIRFCSSFRKSFLKVSILAVIIVLIAEVVFSFISFMNIRILLAEAINNNINTVVDTVNRNLQSVLQKGIQLEDIYDINGYLNKINKYLPEVNQLYLDERIRIKAIPSVAYFSDIIKPILWEYIFVLIGTVGIMGSIITSVYITLKRRSRVLLK